MSYTSYRHEVDKFLDIKKDKALTAVGLYVRGQARLLCSGFKRPTGNLAGKIKYEVGKNEVQIGTNVVSLDSLLRSLNNQDTINLDAFLKAILQTTNLSIDSLIKAVSKSLDTNIDAIILRQLSKSTNFDLASWILC